MLCWRILCTIDELTLYFRSFNGDRYLEAIDRALHHAMTHYKEGCGDLKPYLKSLARDILKVPNRAVPCEEIEEVFSDTNVDISAEVLNKQVLHTDRDIAELALSETKYFLSLCDALLNHCTEKSYYPQRFKETCKRIAKKCSEGVFSAGCIDVYNKYGTDLEKFSGGETDKWVVVDYSLIKKLKSKRFKPIDITGRPVKDLDDSRRPWYIRSSQAGLKIFKVNYTDAWDKMCALVDAEGNNVMKFEINGVSVLKTLGGNLSPINLGEDRAYDICLDEIQTNILERTRARYLGMGHNNMYFVTVDSSVPQDFSVDVKGLHFDFNFKEVPLVES